MNGNYGVPRDIFASIKIVGFIVWDILFVFGSGFLEFLLAPKVFPMTILPEINQMVVFVILTAAIAFYLVLPAKGRLFMIRLKKKSKKKDKSANDFSLTDINSWVEESPIKRIMKNKQEYVELKEYGYLQLLEIQGKDLNSLGQAEVQRTLLNFHDRVTQFIQLIYQQIRKNKLLIKRDV